MEGVRHSVESLCREDHDALGSLETLAGLQGKGKTVGIDAEGDAQRLIGIALDLSPEITGVDQMESIDLAFVLCGAGRHKTQEGLFVVRRLPAVGADTLETVSDITEIHMALADPHAVQSQQAVGLLVSVCAVHIQRQRQRLFKTDRLCPVVDDAHTAHDSVRICKDRIGQKEADVQDRVLHGDLERHRILFVAEGGRKSLQALLALENTMGNIVGLDSGVSSLCTNGHGSVAMIAVQLTGKFMLHTCQNLAALTIIGGRKERVLHIPQHIAQIGIPHAPSEIHMFKELFIIHDCRHIAGVLCINLKNSFLTI